MGFLASNKERTYHVWLHFFRSVNTSGSRCGLAVKAGRVQRFVLVQLEQPHWLWVASWMVCSRHAQWKVESRFGWTQFFHSVFSEVRKRKLFKKYSCGIGLVQPCSSCIFLFCFVYFPFCLVRGGSCRAKGCVKQAIRCYQAHEKMNSPRALTMRSASHPVNKPSLLFVLAALAVLWSNFSNVPILKKLYFYSQENWYFHQLTLSLPKTN